MGHDHIYAMDEDHHDHDAPSHDGSVPPGLDGQRDAPSDHPLLNGEGKGDHDIPADALASQPPHSAPALDSAESSATPDSLSVKPADDSAAVSAAASVVPAAAATADIAASAAPNAHSSAGGDTDQNHTAQVQPQETNNHSTPAPLQSSDTLSTIPDTDGHDSQSFYGLSSSFVGHEHAEDTQQADIVMEATQPTDDASRLPVPPSPSTASTTLAPPSLPDAPRASGSSTTGATDGGAKTPSANRLSISYASGTRRMVIDAEVVDKLKVFRSDARIEIHMRVAKEDERFAGILVRRGLDSSCVDVNFLICLVLIRNIV